MLGRKIRDLRLRRGFTVQQLAAASGLSKGFISQVENGRTSPSLATLRDLAVALKTSVAYLVVEEDQVPHVVRVRERPRVHVGGNTSKVEVLSAQPKRNLELLMAELPPGMSAGDKRHYHHGEECMLVLVRAFFSEHCFHRAFDVSRKSLRRKKFTHEKSIPGQCHAHATAFRRLRYHAHAHRKRPRKNAD